MQNNGIGPWIARKAVRHADRDAIVCGDQRITYGEFSDRIARLTDALAARGVTAGQRVAYLGNNHPSLLEVFFATANLGAIFVPLNTRLAGPELEFMLENSAAKTFVFQSELRDLARAGSWATGVRRLIMVGGTAEHEIEGYEDVVASGGASAAVDRPVTLDDSALILYTSGTTGHPKGAVLTHGNLTWNTFNVVVDYGVSPGERVLLISPMFHVASLTNGALTVLLQGGTVVLHEKFDPGHVLETIERERISMLAGVPTTYQMIQEHEAWATTDISSLQRLSCGGSAVPERTMEAYAERGLGFSMGYGMTETSPSATALPAHMAKHKVGSSGIAHFFTDVKVVDASGSELPPGEIGEIWISGPNVIREYWRRPEATSEAIIDGWLRSGDLGYFDEDGYLFVTDRLKDMIISGGENIYSAEVEAVIMEFSEILGAALIGIPDEKWGEVPLAIVQLRDEERLDPDTIVAHLTGRLAKYKVPKRIVFVDEFPRTASGKIRKADLRKQYVGVSPSRTTQTSR